MISSATSACSAVNFLPENPPIFDAVVLPGGHKSAFGHVSALAAKPDPFPDEKKQGADADENGSYVVNGWKCEFQEPRWLQEVGGQPVEAHEKRPEDYNTHAGRQAENHSGRLGHYPAASGANLYLTAANPILKLRELIVRGRRSIRGYCLSAIFLRRKESPVIIVVTGFGR